MDDVLHVSEEEAQIIDTTLRHLAQERGWMVDSLARLVASWARLVLLLEQGYQFVSHDYENELDVRQIIAELAQSLPEGLQAKLISRLEPWDVRFREVTVQSGEKMCSRPSDELGWWCYRRPREFSDD